MIFAISMDYTVFLLSLGQGALGPHATTRTRRWSAALAHSGRVIFAAAAVMVAVFFTFALSGPLPPKEMGVILGIAVLLDAALVRLLLVPVAAAAARHAGPGGCRAGSTACCPTSASATPSDSRFLDNVPVRGTSAEHATARVPIARPAQSVGEARAALAGQAYECADDLAVLDGTALVGVVPIERLLGAPERRASRRHGP